MLENDKYMVRFAAVVFWFGYPLPSSAQVYYTRDCITGTQEVYMPNPANGECFCGATWIEPNGGYAHGYCTPHPDDEGMRFGGCKRGADDPFGGKNKGKCQYYCTCWAAYQKTGPITCCQPGDEWELVGGIIYRAPPPPPPTHPPGWVEPTTRTHRIVTTVTTSPPPYYGPQKLMGKIQMSTEIPWSEDTKDFLEDEEIVSGVVDGIATKLVVPHAWIYADLTIPAKYIQVNYEITLPAETRGNQSGYALLVAISNADDDVGRTDWGDIMGTSLTKTTDKEYWVAVHSAPMPDIVRLNDQGTVSHAFGAARNVVLLKTSTIVSLFLLWPLFTHPH